VINASDLVGGISVSNTGPGLAASLNSWSSNWYGPEDRVARLDQVREAHRADLVDHLPAVEQRYPDVAVGQRRAQVRQPVFE
jgi:hypothetical protein